MFSYPNECTIPDLIEGNLSDNQVHELQEEWLVFVHGRLGDSLARLPELPKVVQIVTTKFCI